MNVSIRHTNDPRNLVFPFYAIPPLRRRCVTPLPLPDLDDRRFQDLFDDAKRLVHERCPEWSDRKLSDPGVTLIETVASRLVTAAAAPVAPDALVVPGWCLH